MIRRLFAWILPLALLGSWARSADAAATPIGACPFSITAGGTYALVQDLSASGNCIEIAQPLGAGVTVNLNGFTMTGDGSGAAIFASNPGRKISVVGPGTIAMFETGVDLGLTTDVTVKRLTVDDVGAVGVHVNQGSIADSTLSNHGASGLFGVLAGDKTTVTNVTASDGYFAGIRVGARSNVSQSVADNNTIGILAGDKSRVKSSAASGAFVGIAIGPGGTVTQSTVDGAEIGIAGDVASTINNNVVSNSGTGISASCPAIVQQNTIHVDPSEAISFNGEGCTVKNNAITP